MRSDGTLATSGHPTGLGSPLTHPRITTDFSEVQLELITGVHDDVHGCLSELTRVHQVIYQHIGEELLWCASMPCRLPPDEEIPIARYGSSNAGRAKTIYRTGLAHRYGPRMQTVCGIHYNFSLIDARLLASFGGATDAYFALMRNFRRHSWLLVYLLGASPAVAECFAQGREHALRELAPGTLYGPHATSLRMGPLGYQSQAQAALGVSYNSLEAYAASLEAAMFTPYAPYETIGIREGAEYRQLSTGLLQIENEFYGTIRPKCALRTGERPLLALRERGVEYVEVRLIDLDPFAPIGITAQICHLLDLFLVHCLVSESPPDSAEEIAAGARNQHAVALRGREPGLQLEREGEWSGLSEWGAELLAECAPIAVALDAGAGGVHRDALSAAAAQLSSAALTPSARIIDEMERLHGGSHVRFALARSREHRRTLESITLPVEYERSFELMAERSLVEQREIEAGETVEFETYRIEYLSRDRLRP